MFYDKEWMSVVYPIQNSLVIFIGHTVRRCDFSAYYVIGGGVKAAILQDNVAATNGIIHYINRVLGVPYRTMFDIVRNETELQYDFFGFFTT